MITKGYIFHGNNVKKKIRRNSPTQKLRNNSCNWSCLSKATSNSSECKFRKDTKCTYTLIYNKSLDKIILIR